jgi:hypothetical protein
MESNMAALSSIFYVSSNDFLLHSLPPYLGPEFTLPNFDEHAGNLYQIHSLLVIWTAPIVPTGG